MVTLEDLDRVQLFAKLNDKQLQKIQNICGLVEFKRDDKLFTEGDSATHMWIVQNGNVDLRFELPGRATSPETNISTSELKEKDEAAKTLGWSCFVPPYKMRLSAYCVSRSCKIIKIERNELINIMEDDPEMGYKMMSYIVEVVGFRFHQFHDEIARRIGENIISGW